MKMVVLVGSMREGNSLYVANKIKDAYTDAKIFKLGGNIQYCTGCLCCDETHECVIRDDMDVILPAIKEADVVAIVTPVRYSLMSGDVKVFIDRLNPTAVSEDICGKKLLAIAIGQTTKEDGTIQDALKAIEMFANNAALEYLGGYPIYECYGADEVEANEKIVSNAIAWIKEIVEQ